MKQIDFNRQMIGRFYLADIVGKAKIKELKEKGIENEEKEKVQHLL